MSWEEPITNGFQGLNSFFGQVTPYLLPMLLILFVGVTFVIVARRVTVAVTA